MTQEQRRRLKYPDTDTFHYHNANPKNKITTDCVVRAISTALNKPYNEVVMEMAQMYCETGYHTGENKLIDRYMKKHGWVCLKQPKKDDGTKYTGREFCRTVTHPIYCEDLNIPISFELNRILANIGSHHVVAIIAGQIWDTWNSTSGAIGKIWVKPT